MSKRSFLAALVGVLTLTAAVAGIATGAGSQVPGRNGVLSSDIARNAVRASDAANPRWRPLKPINGWSALGEGTRPTKIAKDSFGFVHLRGALGHPTGTNQSPFRVPKPYRPRVVIHLAVAVDSDTTAQLKIDTNGLATIVSQPPLPDRISLEGVSFSR
jgi:hypothetical protein